MARNVEIKARVEDLAALERRAAALADRGPEQLVQDDTFFNCPDGRLKLRAFPDGNGQLIFYRRPDRTGPKTSFYVLSPTAAPDSLRDALIQAYGERGRVRKERTVYWSGRTRIHLDRVERLGTFLELEVVLAEEEDEKVGETEAHDLLRRLGVSPDCLLQGAYLDLLSDS